MEANENLKKNKSVLQFSKFFVVGILNTGLDFIVLNLLMRLTNTYSGNEVIVFNTISFAVAVTNSYILNKRWTFSAQGGPASGREDKNKAVSQTSIEFVKFFAVSVIGWMLNTIILFSITTYIHPVLGLSVALWANVAKATATAVVLAWNFVGYKLFVFKK